MVRMHAFDETIGLKLAEPLRADEVRVCLLPRPRGAGRAPLLALLAAQLGIAPAAVQLLDGEHGRPALAPRHAATFDFNWSHSGEWALVALGYGVAPGIDLEVPRPRPRVLQLAQRFFSAEEAAWLAGQPEDAQLAGFLDLWTAREAVLKALGRGIAFGLDKLAFRRAGDGIRLLHLAGDDVCHWQVHRLELGAGMHAALAWRGPPRHLRVECLPRRPDRGSVSAPATSKPRP